MDIFTHIHIININIDYNNELLKLSKDVKIIYSIILAQDFFTNYYDNFNELKELLNNNTFISGVDLEIEDNISLNHLKLIVNDIDYYFDNFIISMKIYLDSNHSFNKTVEGNRIDYYTCYFDNFDFTLDNYNIMIEEGYKPNKLVIGCTDTNLYEDYYIVISKIRKKYKDFAGVFVIENIPYLWGMSVNIALTSK
jgi:histidinol phosphatase-like PHP family hydrolase